MQPLISLFALNEHQDSLDVRSNLWRIVHFFLKCLSYLVHSCPLIHVMTVRLTSQFLADARAQDVSGTYTLHWHLKLLPLPWDLPWSLHVISSWESTTCSSETAPRPSCERYLGKKRDPSASALQIPEAGSSGRSGSGVVCVPHHCMAATLFYFIKYFSHTLKSTAPIILGLCRDSLVCAGKAEERRN